MRRPTRPECKRQPHRPVKNDKSIEDASPRPAKDGKSIEDSSSRPADLAGSLEDSSSRPVKNDKSLEDASSRPVKDDKSIEDASSRLVKNDKSLEDASSRPAAGRRQATHDQNNIDRHEYERSHARRAQPCRQAPLEFKGDRRDLASVGAFVFVPVYVVRFVSGLAW